MSSHCCSQRLATCGWSRIESSAYGSSVGRSEGPDDGTATEQKLDKLNEAFLYSESIDVTTYGRQRDKLREELTIRRPTGRRATRPAVPCRVPCRRAKSMCPGDCCSYRLFDVS
jgi:hypothetical protein